MSMPTTRNCGKRGGKLGGWKPWSVPTQGSGCEGVRGDAPSPQKILYLGLPKWPEMHQKLPRAIKFANLYFLHI